MNHLAVPQVDVIPDAFDKWGLALGAIGSAAAIVAIIIALIAQRTANVGVADERRRLFDLEILRAFTKDLDEGLADQVYRNPVVLQAYRLRLDLLSTRLRHWDQINGVDGIPEMMTVLGYPEFGVVETRIRELQPILDYLPAAMQTLPILDLQGDAARKNIVDRLTIIDPDLPIVKDASRPWQESTVRLAQLLESLKKEMDQLSKDRNIWLEDGRAELRRRLAEDVSKAALSRVEARPHRKWRRRRIAS